MVFLKRHVYPVIVVILVLALFAILFFYHKKIGNYSNIISAMIGALIGSLGTYTMGRVNTLEERVRASRRMLSLLNYTYDMFKDLEISSDEVVYGKFIYDEKWTEYISYLDYQLSYQQIREIVEWFDSIYLLDKVLENYDETDSTQRNKYLIAQKQISDQKEKINKIISKLEN
ncbi:hypothetical protein [Priestia megaterium]|uniref:hypothetical protein n=1 Tax=Priestia megaterium TaxID=1404 RepID=UPI0030005710